MEMILNDIKCEQEFKYDNNNRVISIKIVSDRECRIVFKNTVTNEYEVKKIGTEFYISKEWIKNDIIYEYCIQKYNGCRFIQATKKYYILFFNKNECFIIFNKMPIKLISDKIKDIGIAKNIVFDVEQCYEYILNNGTIEEKERLEILHSVFFYNFYRLFSLRKISTKEAKKFLNSIPSYIKNYSEKMKFIFQLCDYLINVSDVFKDANYKTKEQIIYDAKQATKRCGYSDSSFAYKYFMALIDSINSREPLYNIQRAVKTEENKVNFSSVDVGIHSFFEIPEDAIKYKKAFQMREIVHGSYEEYGIVLSVEKNFFKIYMPLLMSIISHFDISLSFHIFVVGDKNEINMCNKLFYKMQNVMNEFISKKANIFLYHVMCPDFVKKISTVSACARYMFLDNIIKMHKAIYIMDIDLLIKDYPVDYFNKMQKNDADIVSPGPIYWPIPYPWRRYMAGNIYIKSNKNTEKFLNLVSLYCAYGLKNDISWTLDQNALEYAISKISNLKVENEKGTRFTVTPSYNNVLESSINIKR